MMPLSDAKAISAWLSHKEIYRAKVAEIADRSISVEDLLHFLHETLGASAIDHKAATTWDVVAEIIIPVTAEARLSWADCFAESAQRGPITHVVHAWKMRFEDLLGAVLFHASNGATRRFGNSYQEACGIYANVLHKRYFICCFCINQHCSICDEPHIGCDCGAPKFGDSMPQCEIDKFVDVADRNHLRGADMLLALDPDLHTLSRAWCVDEVSTGMHITVSYNVRPTRHRLRNFHCDVEQCEARQGDKERILERIRRSTGFEMFNKQVTTFIRNSAEDEIVACRRRASSRRPPIPSLARTPVRAVRSPSPFAVRAHQMTPTCKRVLSKASAASSAKKAKAVSPTRYERKLSKQLLLKDVLFRSRDSVN
jgi:hypothetical protein